MNTNHIPYTDSIAKATSILAYTQDNGGGTFVARDGVPIIPPFGYAVGGYQDTVTVDATAVDEAYSTTWHDLVQAIARFIERIPIKPGGGHHYHLGTWIEDGVLYIDAVKIIDDWEEALIEGRNNGEKAIYGFAEGDSFYLDGNGGVVEATPAKTTIDLDVLIEALQQHVEASDRLEVGFRDDAKSSNDPEWRRAAHHNADVFGARGRAFKHAIDIVKGFADANN